MSSNKTILLLMVGGFILLVHQAQAAVTCPGAMSDKEFRSKCYLPRQKIDVGICQQGYDTFKSLCGGKEHEGKNCEDLYKAAHRYCEETYLINKRGFGEIENYNSCEAGVKIAKSKCKN